MGMKLHQMAQTGRVCVLMSFEIWQSYRCRIGGIHLVDIGK